MDAADPTDTTALVLAGGEPPEAVAVSDLPPAGLVIAADSGLHHAADLGLEVTLVVGDFDSVDAEPLERARRRGARIEQHSPDKDATDLELALDAATNAGARRVVVVGGGGGRLDHLLANALVLTAPRFAGLDIEWRTGTARIVVVRSSTELAGTPGELVTLLPVNGPATVTTSGLRWTLHGELLEPGTTRGVSNELAGPSATISVTSGVLLAIHERSTP